MKKLLLLSTIAFLGLASCSKSDNKPKEQEPTNNRLVGHTYETFLMNSVINGQPVYADMEFTSNNNFTLYTKTGGVKDEDTTVYYYDIDTTTNYFDDVLSYYLMKVGDRDFKVHDDYSKIEVPTTATGDTTYLTYKKID